MRMCQVLTEGYIREVDGGRRAASFPDSVRSFAMNFALQSFEWLSQIEVKHSETESTGFALAFRFSEPYPEVEY